MAGNIWCVASNYLAHAKQFNASLERHPIIFLKSGNCYVPSGQVVPLPSFSFQIQYELELALLLDGNLNISHMTAALDLTARDMLESSKAKGLPWTLPKSFKYSCPIGSWEPMDNVERVHIALHVNNTSRQEGFCKDMIFLPEELRSYLLQHFPVAPGDIILTGSLGGASDISSKDLAEVFLNHERKGKWLLQ
ncbi:MAG: FAA hydrolase family protein [Chlamydiae bacterium]|nr:FAA hydrolase family protein [Chlamydiota bacterium]